jgi:two-component system chemotaxis sensor kinase CheA
MQKFSRKNLIFGFLLGLMFPIVAFLINAFVEEGKINILLIMISTAPVILGIFGFVIDVREKRLLKQKFSLETEIQTRIASMQQMLDLTGQGLFSFGPDFLIKPQHSKICEKIFKNKIAGKDVSHLLFPKEKDEEDFKSGLNLFFSGSVKGEVIFDILDSKLRLYNRLYQVEYREISPAEVLVSLNDITDQMVLEEKSNEETERKSILYKVVTHKRYFKNLIDEGKALFQFADSFGSKNIVGDDLMRLKRLIHTFKGNLSFFSFSRSHAHVHEMEYYINDMEALQEDINISEKIVILKKLYFNDLNIVYDHLGESWFNSLDSVTIPREHFATVEKYIKKTYNKDEKLSNTFTYFKKLPLKELFARFPDIAQNLSRNLGKRVKSLEIQGGNIPVLPEQLDPLVSNCIHIIRNMVDHGIEVPADRQQKGKDEEGSINIQLGQKGEHLVLRFSDDGAGIDWKKIEKKARSKGLMTLDEKPNADKLKSLLFSADITTRDGVSVVSGRGIGLFALQQEVKKLQGSIDVKSSKDRGSVFTIYIPKERID